VQINVNATASGTVLKFLSVSCVTSPAVWREGLWQTSPICREPLSHLFEWAWAFSSSTRPVAVRIPTIPCSTQRAWTRDRPQAAAEAMVAKKGQLDGS
jgi:hypothetical protein